MIYLTLDELLFLHDEQIRLFGGAPGVRDHGLLEAALLRPQTGYYKDVVEEAAALWESLAVNHGFVDGNKRIGFEAMHIFLQLNGHDLDVEDEPAIAFIYSNLDAGTFRKDILDEWLRRHVRAI